MDKRCIVMISPFAEKQIVRLPSYIKGHLQVWAETFEMEGIRAVRRLPGYHDEPLRGDREGQRSVRLSRAYRVIYEKTAKEEITLIAVQEITKHGY